MRYFRRHADAFAKRGVRVYGFANVLRVGAHLDSQSDFTNQVACIGTDNCATQNLAVTMCFGTAVEQQFGKALIYGHSRRRGPRRPKGTNLFCLMPCALASVSVRPTHATSGSV